MSIANKTFFALAAAGVLLLASLLLVDDFAPAVANAETVRTKKSTRVMSRPKGTARVVVRVGSGRDLVVLSRRGRWLKVKVNGKTGWVVKSSTSASRSARKSVSKTRRRPVVTRRSKPAPKRAKKKPKKTRTASRSKKKPVVKKTPVVKVKKRKRPDVLDDDEEFLDEAEIEAEAENKRIAAREKKARLRREREERERQQEEADRLARERKQRARREKERKRRDLEIRRREHEERRERELAEEREREERERDRRRPERKSRAHRSGDYEDFDLDDDDDDDDRDREPRRRSRDDDEDSDRDRNDRRRYDADEYEDEDEDDEPRRRRVVVVKVDTAGVYAKPSSRSRELGVAEDGEKLKLVRESRSGKWFMVADKSGETGWIRAIDVRSGDDDDASGSEESNVVARGGVSAGYTTMGSMFESNGVGELANYEFTTAAASVALVGEVAVHYGDSYVLAVDAHYSGTRADPGIRFMNSSGQVADIALTNHEVDAGGSIGLRLSKNLGTMLLGRVGYHYGMMSIDEVSNFDINLAMLPSEVLKGMTLGGKIDIPKFGDSLGVSLGGDVLYPNGTRVQTDGLEDGAQAKVFAAWATAHITYRTAASITIEAIYRYSYATTDWTGTVDSSLRPHNASEARRTDVSHTALLGLGRSF